MYKLAIIFGINTSLISTIRNFTTLLRGNARAIHHHSKTASSSVDTITMTNKYCFMYNILSLAN